MVRNLPFRKKIGLFFFLIVVAFVTNAVQAVMSYNTNRSAWSQDQQTRRIGTIINRIGNDYDHVIQEVEYFLRIRNANVAAHAAGLLEGLLPQLEELQGTRALPDDALIGLIRERIAAQTVNFERIRRKYQEIGVNENSGEHGRIREGIHQVEAMLSERGQFEMLASMLQLRRHEKDLMDRKEVRYLQKFNSEVERFQELVNRTDSYTPEERRRIRELFADYSRGFYIIASELLSVTGLVEGFRNDAMRVDAAMGELQAVLERIYKDHDVRLSDLLLDQFLRSQGTIFVVLALIGFLLAWIQYDMLTAVEGLSAVARRVADGEKPVIVVDRKDEIGGLARSLASMQSSLSARHRELLAKVQALRESEKRYAALLHLADYAIVSLDDGLRIAAWNRGARESFGWEEGTMLGRSVFDLVTDDNRLELATALEGIRGNSRFRRLGEAGDFHCCRVGGERFPATLSLSMWEMEGEGRHHFTLILRDIGERVAGRRQIERALDLRSAISGILQQSLLPLTLEEILGRALRIVLAIPWLGVEQRGAIFLYNPESGQLELTVHRDLSPSLLEQCRSVPMGHCLCGRAAASGEVVMSNGLDQRHETRFDGMHDHGHYCVPILSDQARLGVLNVYLMAGHAFDEEEIHFLKNIANTLAGLISRRHAENRITQLLATLDAKVVERTRELNQKVRELESTRHELIESEKMASLGRLVAGIAHEVNTPIGVAFSAATQLLEERGTIGAMLESEEVDADELMHSMHIVEEASTLVARNLQRAAELIQSFKRASIDHTSEAVRDFQLAEVVQDVLMSLRNRFKKTGITIEVVCPEALRVAGAPGYLNQILTNLLLNSLIHGFDEGRRSGLITLRFAADGHTLAFDYADDGAGMSEETRQRAFEPFFTTHRGSGGSGLGLYICYNLVTTKLRGTVSLVSAPGAGMRLACSWPVVLRSSVGSP